MTDEECKTKLAEICEDIVQQNHELMNGLDQPDFDPAIRLDNAKNNAGYKLTNFFDILKLFPHGSVPDEMTSELITTTDALIVKIRKKYGNTGKAADTSTARQIRSFTRSVPRLSQKCAEERQKANSPGRKS